jgi:hypothetical protein
MVKAVPKEIEKSHAMARPFAQQALDSVGTPEFIQAV